MVKTNIESEAIERKANAEKFQIERIAEANQFKIKQEAEAAFYKTKCETDANQYQITQEAEASFHKMKYETDAEQYHITQQAEAVLSQQKNEAQGILALLTSQADGLTNLLQISNDPKFVMQYLMMQNGTLEKLAKQSADAIQGLNPKITHWTTGGDGSNQNPLTNLFQNIPPILDTIYDQVGIKPSKYIIDMEE